MRGIWWGVGVVLAWGCAEHPAPKTALTDAQFVDLFVTVYALYDSTDTPSDSLKVHRQVVFDRYHVTPDMVQEFIDQHRRDPDSWTPIMAMLQERLGETAQVKLEAFRTQSPSDTTKQKKSGP